MFLSITCTCIVPLCTSPPFIDTTPACLRLNFCKFFFSFLLSYLCLLALFHSLVPHPSLVLHPHSLMPCPSLVLHPHSLVPCPFLMLCHSLVPRHSVVPRPCLVPHLHSLLLCSSLLCATSLLCPHPHTLHTAPTPLPLAYLGCITSRPLHAVSDASPLVSVCVPAPACTCIRNIGLD